jgi:hypothetical protein
VVLFPREGRVGKIDSHEVGINFIHKISFYNFCNCLYTPHTLISKILRNPLHYILEKVIFE